MPDLAKGSDLLVIDATARPGVAAETLEAAIVDIVDDYRANGARPDERDRVLALVETAFLTGMQTVADRADQLSRFATYFGDPDLINGEVARYRAVTSDHMRAFAESHLSEDNRASLVFVAGASGSPEPAP